MVFLGRDDHQVKFRGLRIELGEIEAAIADSGLTRAAAVMARDGRIVAWIVPGDGYDADTLRDMLAARLPDYMVPAALVEMPRLPVTANGKLDRKALPAPRFASGGGNAPEGPDEQRLAALYAEILSLDGPPGRDDDFFALGGDSLLAVQLMLRIAEEWGHDPGFGALFEAPDIASLARRIAGGTAICDEGLAPVITLARAGGGHAPLFLVHPAGESAGAIARSPVRSTRRERFMRCSRPRSIRRAVCRTVSMPSPPNMPTGWRSATRPARAIWAGGRSAA